MTGTIERHMPSEKTNNFADLYRSLIMVLALNVPGIYLILLLDMQGVEFSFLTWFYLTCVVLGYYVLPLLLIMTLVFLFTFAFRRVATLAVGAIVTMFVYYLLIDHFAYSIARIHIDLFWLEWIISDYAGLGLPSSTLRTALLALLGIIGVEIGIFALARRVRRPRHLIWVFSLLTILAFGISQVIHIVAYQRNDNRITSLTPHLPVYVPFTSHEHAKKYGGLLSLDESAAGGSSAGDQGSFIYPLGEITCRLSPDRTLPNIVIIFLEGWRYDSMNESVTPNIFTFSRKSSVFLKHFCSGNSTIAGTFGFFYGLHPTYWTAVKANTVLIDNPVFIDLLEENRYALGIYARSNFERHKIKDAVFRGIEVHESLAGDDKIEQDRDLTRQVRSFLREQVGNPDPFLAFAFYKSNHFPYLYPPEDSVFLPAGDLNLMYADETTDPESFHNDYRNSTHFVDAQVGEVLRELDSLGHLENTIVIITTDHGEQFNDNRANSWGHGSNFTQYQTRVPLIVYAPDREAREIEYATSHIDIVPTLLQDYFGCTNDIRDYSNGRNLFEAPTSSRPFVVGSYVNHAFIIDDNVYEIYPVYTREYKLRNIREKASRADPQLLRDVIEEIGRFYQGRDNRTLDQAYAIPTD